MWRHILSFFVCVSIASANIHVTTNTGNEVVYSELNPADYTTSPAGPGASSILSPDFDASKAFGPGKVHWSSGQLFDGTGGLIYGFPHMIWYNFNTDIRPYGVTFHPQPWNDCEDYGYCGPKDWEFVGSTATPCNDKSPWATLCTVSDGTFKSPSEIQGCFVDTTAQYKCLGVRVFASFFPDYATVSISGLKFYERE